MKIKITIEPEKNEDLKELKKLLKIGSINVFGGLISLIVFYFSKGYINQISSILSILFAVNLILLGIKMINHQKNSLKKEKNEI